MRGLLAIVFAGLHEVCRQFAVRHLWKSERWSGRAEWCDQQARNFSKRDEP